MAWASTLPAVVAKLSDVLTQALDPTKVLVWSYADASAFMETVTIAYQGQQDSTVAEGQFSAEGLAANPDREVYAVHCMAAVRDGAGDVGAAAGRAFTLLAAVGAALAADRKLSGLVLTSTIGAWTLAAIPDTRGAIAELAFDIDIDAFTTR